MSSRGPKAGPAMTPGAPLVRLCPGGGQLSVAATAETDPEGRQVARTLFYPGDLDGAAGLRFMGVLEAEHNYRPKIF